MNPIDIDLVLMSTASKLTVLIQRKYCLTIGCYKIKHRLMIKSKYLSDPLTVQIQFLISPASESHLHHSSNINLFV